MSGLEMEVNSSTPTLSSLGLCSSMSPGVLPAAHRQVCDTQVRLGDISRAGRVLTAAAATSSDPKAQNVSPGMLTGHLTPAKVTPRTCGGPDRGVMGWLRLNKVC